MKLTFLQTGGTIDKDYPRTTKGRAFEIEEPAVQRILEKLNPSFEYELFSVLKKDSLDITEDDRRYLLDFCRQLENDKIIITHGTDTMLESAKFLAPIATKTIVITGAMRPERFSNSDAPINVGAAIGAISFLKNGVFIAMHGRVLPFDNIKRDLETGQFLHLV